MDVADTPEEAAVRAEARAWLEAHARRRRGDGDWSRGVPGAGLGVDSEGEAEYVERCRTWQRTLYDGGWAGITWPTEHGGRGAPRSHEIVFRQEEATFDVTSGFLASGIALVGPTLMVHGTDAQRARYLRPLLRGDEIWCQLFSEPGAGSDLAGLRTRAVRDGDEWVVDGQKVWTSGAHHADFAILIARTDPAVPKHRGITYFPLDMRTPGIDVRPLRQINGAAHFNEVFLTDVRVPHAGVVGEVNHGWAVAHTTLASESTMIGTSSIVDVDGLLRLAADGAGRDPLLRQRLADVYIRARILRFLGDRVQTALLRGSEGAPDGSVLKLLWAEAGARAAAAGLALQGPLALLLEDVPQDGYWQQQFLKQFHWRIGGGTEEIHRTMIGERALGLPVEPRVDKDVPFRLLPA